ncbi:MAG: hypothetical protein ACOH1Z_09195 [Rhodoglobus sp.]
MAYLHARTKRENAINSHNANSIAAFFADDYVSAIPDGTTRLP